MQENRKHNLFILNIPKISVYIMKESCPSFRELRRKLRCISQLRRHIFNVILCVIYDWENKFNRGKK
jgi:hypothetical protein